MEDLEIINKVVSRVAASKKKLNPTQLKVLENPDRVRTKTEEKTLADLVELGYVEAHTPEYTWNKPWYSRTQEGQDYLNALENDKESLTPENIREVARKFPDFLKPRIDIDRLRIDLVLQDPAHGNTAVHTVKKVPKDNKEVEKIVNDLLEEIRHRGKATRERWKYIPR